MSKIKSKYFDIISQSDEISCYNTSRTHQNALQDDFIASEYQRIDQLRKRLRDRFKRFKQHEQEVRNPSKMP